MRTRHTSCSLVFRMSEWCFARDWIVCNPCLFFILYLHDTTLNMTSGTPQITATLCSTVSVQYLMSPCYISYQSSEDSRLKLWDRLSTGVARGGSLTLPSLGLFRLHWLSAFLSDNQRGTTFARRINVPGRGPRLCALGTVGGFGHKGFTAAKVLVGTVCPGEATIPSWKCCSFSKMGPSLFFAVTTLIPRMTFVSV